MRVDDGLSAFLSVRPRLFGIAYRMLNSKAAAEDIVQDAWVRWQTADRGRVRNAAAFLVTTTRRLAINVMQSARSRRETHVGAWLQPVDTGADPRLGAERRQALAFGVLLLLEKLTPTERAAYILREAFDYPYREIANVLRLERSQCATSADPRPGAGRKWRKDVGESDRATTSSRRYRCCGPEWRCRRPRERSLGRTPRRPLLVQQARVRGSCRPPRLPCRVGRATGTGGGRRAGQTKVAIETKVWLLRQDCGASDMDDGADRS